MKKNFFKKLSFVLALAMIVSVIAPAAGAFAATAPKLSSSTTKYLHLSGITGSNEYDFNITNKKTGWKYNWTSADEKVAVVAKNGLTTAVGVGTTKISVVISDKDGEEFKKLTATVVVRDNIKTVDIKNAPAKGVVKIGAVYDFNRSFTTEAGSTTKTSSVTRWTVKEDGASFANIDKFTATKVGTYTVTASSFQSTAKYDAYKADPVKYASYLLDTAECTVEVLPTVISTKQLNATKFTVEFDADMSASTLKTASAVYKVINGKQVTTGAEKIKAITFDTTGKIATVEMYTSLTASGVYNFVYGDVLGAFTAAATDAKYIKGIVFDDFNVDTSVGQAMLAKVHAIDANGVVIAEGADIASYLTFTYSGDLAQGYLIGNTAYINVKGYSTILKVKYSNVVYNDTTKVYDTITFEDAATAVGSTADTNVNPATMQSVVVTSTTAFADIASTAWTTANKLAAKDSGYRIVTRYKLNNAESTTAYSDDYSTVPFIYESSNTDKLLVSGQFVYPIAAGTVTVIVKNNDTDKKVVGTFDITIMDARTLASATQDVNVVTVGNNATVGETKKSTVTLKDTMGSSVDIDSIGVPTFISKPANATNPTVTTTKLTGDDLGKVTINVDGRSATAGAYNIEVKFTEGDVTKTVYVTAIVAESITNTTVTSYKLELDSTSVNLKDIKATDDIVVSVYAYNSNNVRVALVPVNNYTVVVKDSSGNTEAINANANIPVVGTTGSAILAPFAVDSYVVSATVTGSAIGTKAVGAYLGAATFVVTDTTTKEVAVDTTVVTYAATTLDTVLEAVQKAFTFKLNGSTISDVNEANITKVTYSTGASALVSTPAAIVVGQNIFISEVDYTVTNTNGTHTVYTFKVNTTLAVK